jgi:hypothetical protein
MAERQRVTRSSGSGGGPVPLSDSKLSRELARLQGNSFGINESNENLFFDNALAAHAAYQAGKWKTEQALQVAYNLSLISDLVSYSPTQAVEMIKTAAEGGKFAVVQNTKNVSREHVQPVISVPPAGKMRPLTANERKEAKAANLSAKEWYDKIGRKRDIESIDDIGLTPVVAQQIHSPVTGNGIQAPGQFEDNPPEEESPELIREKKLYTNNQTANTEPAGDGRNAPSRHSSASVDDISKRMADLRKELAAVERQHVEVVVVGTISERVRAYLKKSPENSDRLLEAVLSVVNNFESPTEKTAGIDDTVIAEPVVSDEDIADYLRGQDEPA